MWQNLWFIQVKYLFLDVKEFWFIKSFRQINDVYDCNLESSYDLNFTHHISMSGFSFIAGGF